MKAAEERLKQAKVNGTVGTTWATIVVPSFRSAQEAPARIDRRIAALRIIEVLRLHADVHDGKLPASLDEIKVVPIPSDPMTGNPFQYRLDNERATLFAPAPEGDTPRVSNVLMYELTMKASSK